MNRLRQLNQKREVRDAVLRVAILHALVRASTPLNAVEIADATNSSGGKIFALLSEMTAQGYIERHQLECPRRYVFELTNKGRSLWP